MEIFAEDVPIHTQPASSGVYDQTTVLWSWLFPLTYLIHVAEEYWGGEGYPAYIFKLRGVHLSNTRFLAAQSVGFVLVIVGILLARKFRFLPMMLVILGSMVAVNALTHTVTALSTLKYAPGLWSSIFVWGPIGIASMVRFKALIRKQKQYWLAIAIGAGINVVIGILTMRGGRVL